MSRPPRPMGALHALGGLLILSAVLRIALAGEAIAEALPSAPLETATEKTGETTTALLEALRNREERLREKELRIEDRMRALEIAEREARERITHLTEAEMSLRAMLEQVDQAAETDVDRLVAVYENMKPKEAADLFNQMPPNFAAGFLALLTPQTAGQILALVEPEKAYSISVVLAGRNADIPLE